MWELYERPKRERRKNIFAGININKGGMFLNRMACELIGMGPGDVRYFLFFTDKEKPNLYGFLALLSPQKHEKNVYKVRYREFNRTAKVNAKQFIILHRMLEKAAKVGESTFPLTKEKDDFYSFEIK